MNRNLKSSYNGTDFNYCEELSLDELKYLIYEAVDDLMYNKEYEDDGEGNKLLISKEYDSRRVLFKEFIIRKYIVAMYTDISIPVDGEVDFDDMMNVYNVYTYIKDLVNKEQIEFINVKYDELYLVKKEELLHKSKFDDLCDSINGYIDIIAEKVKNQPEVTEEQINGLAGLGKLVNVMDSKEMFHALADTVTEQVVKEDKPKKTRKKNGQPIPYNVVSDK